MDVFCSAVAQHQNLGDAVLRRQMLDLLPDTAGVHLLGEKMPASYLQFVQEGGGDRSLTVYSTTEKWARELARSTVSRTRKTVLMYSPGPQRVSGAGFKGAVSEMARLGLNLLVRATGGRVLRPGRSYEGSQAMQASIVKASIWTAHLATHRDDREPWAETAGSRRGPDVAVTWQCESPVPPMDSRRYVAVSLRFDRGHDLDVVADRMRQLVKDTGLNPLVFSQVTFDEEQATRLAAKLECEVVMCRTSDRDSISALVAKLSECAIVVSDRLHALVFALVQGACPVVLNPSCNPKALSAMAELVPDVQTFDLANSRPPVFPDVAADRDAAIRRAELIRSEFRAVCMN